MTLFTREEKRNKELMEEYERLVQSGMKPQKAARQAKQKVLDK